MRIYPKTRNIFSNPAIFNDCRQVILNSAKRVTGLLAIIVNGSADIVAGNTYNDIQTSIIKRENRLLEVKKKTADLNENEILINGSELVIYCDSAVHGSELELSIQTEIYKRIKNDIVFFMTITECIDYFFVNNGLPEKARPIYPKNRPDIILNNDIVTDTIIKTYLEKYIFEITVEREFYNNIVIESWNLLNNCYSKIIFVLSNIENLGPYIWNKINDISQQQVDKEIKILAFSSSLNASEYIPLLQLQITEVLIFYDESSNNAMKMLNYTDEQFRKYINDEEMIYNTLTKDNLKKYKSYLTYLQANTSTNDIDTLPQTLIDKPYIDINNLAIRDAAILYRLLRDKPNYQSIQSIQSQFTSELIAFGDSLHEYITESKIKENSIVRRKAKIIIREHGVLMNDIGIDFRLNIALELLFSWNILTKSHGKNSGLKVSQILKLLDKNCNKIVTTTEIRVKSNKLNQFDIYKEKIQVTPEIRHVSPIETQKPEYIKPTPYIPPRRSTRRATQLFVVKQV